MKTFFIIITFITISLSARSQQVDTTNTNRVILIFTARQQTILNVAFGDNWKKRIVEQITERCNLAFNSDASEQIATKAKQDSLAYYRRQISRIKEELK